MTDAARTPFAEQDDEELAPRAAPVDTFIRAQVPQDLTPNLNSLLKGLSEFDNGVQSFIDKQDAAGKEDAQAQARYDALRESAGLPASSPSSAAHGGIFGGIFTNLFGTDASPLKTPALPSTVTAPQPDPNAAPTSPAITPTSAGPAVPSPVPTMGTPPLPPARPAQGELDALGAQQTVPTIDTPAGEAPPTTSATEGTPNAQGLAIGVGTGLLPAQANPAYSKQLQQSRGELAGEQIKSRFTLEANQAGIGSMTQEQYLAWRKDWLSRNLGSSMTPDTMRGLVPQLDAMMKQGLQQYTGERDKYLREQGTQAQGAQFNQVLDAANVPVQGGQSLDVQGTYEQLSKVRAAWMAVNQDPAKADHQFITAVTAQAIKTGNKDYLTILDQPVPGKDYTYAQTQEGRAAYTNSSDAIDTNKAQDDKAALAARAAQDKAYEKGVTGQAMEFIQKNPGAPVPDAIVNDPRMRAIDPEFPQKMAELGKKYAGDHGPQDDQPHITQMERDIINAGPGQAVAYLHQHMGEVNNPETLTKLNTLAENADKGGPKLQEILKDPSYTGYHKMIDNALGDPTKFDVFNGQNGQSPASADYKHKMDMAVLNWAAQHPNATYIETFKAINEIGQAATTGLPKQPVVGALPPPAAPPFPDIPAGGSTPRAPAPAQAPAATKPPGGLDPDGDPVLPGAPAPASQEATPPSARASQQLDPDGDPVLPHPGATSQQQEPTPAQAVAMTSPQAQQAVTAYHSLPPEQKAVIDADAKAAGYSRPELYVAAHAGGAAVAPDVPPATAPMQAKPMSYTQTPQGGDYYSRIRQIESGGRNVTNSGSGATGPFQFLPSTWDKLIEHHPELGFTHADIHDPAKQEVAIHAFTEDNRKYLQSRLGRAPTDAELYLAHQQGAGGAARLLAHPGMLASELVDPRAITGNGGTAGMTAKEFTDMWAKRYGGMKGVAPQGGVGDGVIDPSKRAPVPGGYEANAPGAAAPIVEAAAAPAQVQPPGGQGGGSEGGGVDGPRAGSQEDARAAAQEAAEQTSRKRRRRPGKDSGSQSA